MSEPLLTQAEADRLIALEKKAVSMEYQRLPELGGVLNVALTSLADREEFQLDVSRGRIDLRKGTNQLRAYQAFPLIRLDFGGRPHRNPDDVEIPSPHLHIYREGFGDKWAYPLPEGVFTNLNDQWTTLHEFMDYCKIVAPPRFLRGLFG